MGNSYNLPFSEWQPPFGSILEKQWKRFKYSSARSLRNKWETFQDIRMSDYTAGFGYGMSKREFLELVGNKTSSLNDDDDKETEDTLPELRETDEPLGLWERWVPEYAGTVDAAEVWSGLFLIARDKCKSKLSALFDLFDVDDDGRLSHEEVESLIVKACTALCKMTQVSVPSIEILQKVAEMPFGHVEWLERHGGLTLTKNQFIHWVVLTP
jgi:hypothetical protein